MTWQFDNPPRRKRDSRRRVFEPSRRWSSALLRGSLWNTVRSKMDRCRHSTEPQLTKQPVNHDML
jgi:hypothetical protein